MQATLSKYFNSAGGSSAAAAAGLPPPSEPWACVVCTFRHEGGDAVKRRCRMCETPREGGSPSAAASPAALPTPGGGSASDAGPQKRRAAPDGDFPPPAKRAVPAPPSPPADTPPSAVPPSATPPLTGPPSVPPSATPPLTGPPGVALDDIEHDDSRHAWFAAQLAAVSQRQREEAEAAERDAAAALAGGSAPKGKSKSKLTPFEAQVVALKRANPGVLLMIECGYRFRFFGDDARIAAEELSIYAHRDRAFMVASVPSHRVAVHARRLVAAGHKVGVVRQTETAAIKSASKSSGTFAREVAGVYTRATIGDASDEALVGRAPPAVEPWRGGGGPARFRKRKAPEPEAPAELPEDLTALADDGDQRRTHYILALTEQKSSDITRDTRVGLVAVDVASGDVVFDEFADDHQRSELETRLRHLRPAELLLPPALATSASEDAVAQFQAQGEVRTDRADGFSGEAAQAALAALAGDTDEGEVEALAAAVARLSELPPLAFATLGALVPHLRAYRLASAVMAAASATRPFAAANRMELDGVTLADLEVLKARGAEDRRGVYGSLLWALDHTVTGFGSRLMARWVRAPLLARGDIERRQAAVTLLAFAPPDAFAGLRARLKKLPDLEYGVARLQRAKTGPRDLATTLQAVQGTAEALPTGGDADVDDPLLQSLLANVPDVRPVVDGALRRLRLSVAQDNQRRGVFADESEFAGIRDCRAAIAETERGLRAELQAARDLLGMPELEFKSLRTGLSSSIEHLIELTHAQSAKAPADWTEVNPTKKHKRWHTPRVLELQRRLALERERLEVEADRAWLEFVRGLGRHCGLLRRFVECLAELDCLLSLAQTASRPGYVAPEFTGERVLDVRAARHPMAEGYQTEAFVPNDVRLGGGAESCLVLGGPNMGGKSSYARTVALVVIMAQIGSYVPAQSARLCVLDAVFTRMGAADDIVGGASTFMVELWQTSRILQRASERSLVVLDELGRGTSTHDGVAIAQATLEHLARDVRCFTVFITHYASLCRPVEGQVAVGHMAFSSSSGDGEDEYSITFLYKLQIGQPLGSYGLNVARLAGLDRELLGRAEEQANVLRLACSSPDELDALVRGMVEKGDAAGLRRVKAAVGALQAVEGGVAV